MKDHEIAQLVNELTKVAVEFRDSQQLRERIAQLVRPLTHEAQRLDRLRERIFQPSSGFGVYLAPTPEQFQAPINGVQVPTRIWQGTTSSGVLIEAYVLAITPEHEDDVETLRKELPEYMKPARDTFHVDLEEKCPKCGTKDISLENSGESFMCDHCFYVWDIGQDA